MVKSAVFFRRFHAASIRRSEKNRLGGFSPCRR
jgi:hypothetical protein